MIYGVGCVIVRKIVRSDLVRKRVKICVVLVDCGSWGRYGKKIC